MDRRDSAGRSSDAEQPAADWSEHEHSSPPMEMQAVKLLREAGSLDLAKHAVDAAAKSVAAETSARHRLALRLGFKSYFELAAASTPLVIPGDDRWRVTPCGDRWIAWNSEGVVLQRDFASLEEARRNVVAGA